MALYVPQNFTANENQTENHKVFENHCQGVIISKWQILTAAHCILGDEDRIRIVSGTSIIFRHLPTDLPYRKPINSKIFPLYVAGDLINDIPYSFDYNSHSIIIRIRLVFAIFRNFSEKKTNSVRTRLVFAMKIGFVSFDLTSKHLLVYLNFGMKI